MLFFVKGWGCVCLISQSFYARSRGLGEGKYGRFLPKKKRRESINQSSCLAQTSIFLLSSRHSASFSVVVVSTHISAARFSPLAAIPPASFQSLLPLLMNEFSRPSMMNWIAHSCSFLVFPACFFVSATFFAVFCVVLDC
eukprot:GABV01008585.1.p1 GENE.GABV01008585.1~~GABV01008585.1.p1  ORF type:complete len:140 (-),score=20.66 GABV01008585.1:322-741(-)